MSEYFANSNNNDRTPVPVKSRKTVKSHSEPNLSFAEFLIYKS